MIITRSSTWRVKIEFGEVESFDFNCAIGVEIPYFHFVTALFSRKGLNQRFNVLSVVIKVGCYP